MVKIPAFSFGRKERAILDGISEHLSLVKSTVASFAELVRTVANGDPRAQPIADRVFEMETRADSMQRELGLKVAEGAFFGGVREDIINLIEKIDNIADSAKDAARLLMIGRDGDPEAMKILASDDMGEFLKSLQAAVAALEGLVAAFRVDKKAVLARVPGVEECEEAADSKKDALLTALFRDRHDADPVTVIQVRDFLFTADDIADNAEDASDVILVLVAKGYG